MKVVFDEIFLTKLTIFILILINPYLSFPINGSEDGVIDVIDTIRFEPTPPPPSWSATANIQGKGHEVFEGVARNTGNTPFFKWCRSIDEAACCCQPCVAMCPGRAIKTCPVQDLSALHDCLDRPHIKTSLQH